MPPQARPAVDRFNEKWVEDESGCWLWTASTIWGYGHFSIGRQSIRAHRWSYEHHVGPIPDGLVLDHLCRVKRCVNPLHLEPVTVRENTLRGVSVFAENARKTHCPKGHPYDSGNTYVTPAGTRACRTCQRAKPQRKRGPIPGRLCAVCAGPISAEKRLDARYCSPQCRIDARPQRGRVA